jgi:hypothetical protein
MATFTSHYIISPFVAMIPYPYQFKPNSREVAEIIEVPLSTLQDKNNFKEAFELYYGELTPVYSYEYQGHLIWGATARILKQFLDFIS